LYLECATDLHQALHPYFNLDCDLVLNFLHA
jgi:hypothetical protein